MTKMKELLITAFCAFIGMTSGALLYQAITGEYRWDLAIDRSWFMFLGIIGLTILIVPSYCRRRLTIKDWLKIALAIIIGVTLLVVARIQLVDFFSELIN